MVKKGCITAVGRPIYAVKSYTKYITKNLN